MAPVHTVDQQARRTSQVKPRHIHLYNSGTPWTFSTDNSTILCFNYDVFFRSLYNCKDRNPGIGDKIEQKIEAQNLCKETKDTAIKFCHVSMTAISCQIHTCLVFPPSVEYQPRQTLPEDFKIAAVPSSFFREHTSPFVNAIIAGSWRSFEICY